MERSSKLSKDIKDTSRELQDLKEKYTFYQRCQTYNRQNLPIIEDPNDECPKEYYETEIHDCRFTLNIIQQEIKELKIKLKKLQRELNKNI